VISIEITSIWFAGAASLYNREFYQLARAKLRPDGVLQQWVQLHHMATTDLLTIIGTLRAEFAYVSLYGFSTWGLEAFTRTVGQVFGPDRLSDALGDADAVVLAVPRTDETRALFGRAEFAAMKPAALLVNVARGRLIDDAALIEALRTGEIAGAGLDVYWEEPVDPKDPIFRYNVFTTPHIGGSTDVSITGIVQVVADNILRVEKNEEPLYVK
jgi:phosphoglycerate dehydrogenase-like enzyme